MDSAMAGRLASHLRSGEAQGALWTVWCDSRCCGRTLSVSVIFIPCHASSRPNAISFDSTSNWGGILGGADWPHSLEQEHNLESRLLHPHSMDSSTKVMMDAQTQRQCEWERIFCWGSRSPSECKKIGGGTGTAAICDYAILRIQAHAISSLSHICLQLPAPWVHKVCALCASKLSHRQNSCYSSSRHRGFGFVTFKESKGVEASQSPCLGRFLDFRELEAIK